MKLTFRGRTGSMSCAWETFALLRDNVEHYIEQGAPTRRFPAIHAIEDAVDRGNMLIDAAALRGEVLHAWYALWKVPLQHAAVSLRTRAIMTHSTDRPMVRGTIRALDVGWELPVDTAIGEPVSQAAQPFVEAVLAVTAITVDGDRLEVSCL